MTADRHFPTHSDSSNIRLCRYAFANRVVADEYAAVSAKIDALYGQAPQLPADYETTGMARLRRETHARMLGNGLCTRPAGLACRMESACETCAYFRTDTEFLPTAFGEVARSSPALQPVVAVPPAPAVAHLYKPGPDLIRWRIDGDSAGGLIPRWDKIIAGKRLTALLTGCPQPKASPKPGPDGSEIQDQPRSRQRSPRAKGHQGSNQGRNLRRAASWPAGPAALAVAVASPLNAAAAAQRNNHTGDARPH